MILYKYVIAGMPRSGTHYMAEVMRRLDIDCGHEKYLKPDMWVEERQVDGPWGVCSWEPVPFLGLLREGTVIARIARHPLKIMNSILAGPNWWPYMYRRMLPNKMNPLPEPRRSIPWFWYLWNVMMDPYCVYEFRLEDKQGLKRELLHFTDRIGARRSYADISKVIDELRPVHSHSVTPPTTITWDDLDERMIRMARRFGYGPEKEKTEETDQEGTTEAVAGDTAQVQGG